jgi:hypothetical protein
MAWKPPIMKNKLTSRRRRSNTKSALRLLDVEHAKTAALNSLTSSDAQRGYRASKRFKDRDVIASRRSSASVPGTCKGGDGATRALGQRDERNQTALHSRYRRKGTDASLCSQERRTCAQHAAKGYVSSAFGLRIEPVPAGLSPALARYMMLDPYGGNLEQAVLCVAPRGASPLHDDRRRYSDPEKAPRDRA